MCFYIHSKHPEPKTAKEDESCYKIGYLDSIHNKFRSEIMKFSYQLNKVYSTKIDGYGDVIRRGFNSFKTKKDALEDNTWGNDIVKCTIPKGATYYYNPDLQEYVSNKIKILKPI